MLTLIYRFFFSRSSSVPRFFRLFLEKKKYREKIFFSREFLKFSSRLFSREKKNFLEKFFSRTYMYRQSNTRFRSGHEWVRIVRFVTNRTNGQMAFLYEQTPPLRIVRMDEWPFYTNRPPPPYESYEWTKWPFYTKNPSITNSTNGQNGLFIRQTPPTNRKNGRNGHFKRKNPPFQIVRMDEMAILCN